MGADHDDNKRIRTFVSIEGDLTYGDMFISLQVHRVTKKQDESFDYSHYWFIKTFQEDIVRRIWTNEHYSHNRYHAALHSARIDNFQKNVLEIYSGHSHNTAKSKWLKTLNGITFSRKHFCFGIENLPLASENVSRDTDHTTREYLNQDTTDRANTGFAFSDHRVHNHASKQFYAFLENFIG